VSIIKSIMHQLGLSGDPAKNFTLSVPAAPDGTMKLARGNAGATTQDIMTVDAAGKVRFPQNVRALQQKAITIGVEYTNNTGGELYVSMIVDSPSATRAVTLSVNGFQVATARAELNVSASFMCAVVPIGGTFFVTLNIGVGGDLYGTIIMNGPVGGVTP